MRTEEVSSASNPKFKKLLALREKSSLRRSEGLFVAEGRREIENMLSAGFVAETVFICRDIFPDCGALLEKAAEANQSLLAVEIPRALYAKAAFREGTEGILAEVRCHNLRLEDIPLRKDPLVIVLEAVEKPGNLGAVLRSADAAGADAVLVCDPLTDLYNPNLIRASLGAIFTVPCVACSSDDAIGWLKAHKIKILTAQLQDSELYYDTPMTGGTAIVMGAESTGLSPVWRQSADAHIRIPMLGTLDSLNVSVSAAILLFEAVRQRNA